jgi:alpha-tubulin suppressor-like RCC1 family protein
MLQSAKWNYSQWLAGFVCLALGPGIAAAVDSKIAAGGYSLFDDHALAIDASGRVLVWGANRKSQLGRPVRSENESTPTPEVVAALADQTFIAIGGGPWNAAAVRADGTVWAWGSAEQTGGLGVTSPVIATTPLRVPGVTDAVGIHVGRDTTFVWTRTGQVYSWGDATFGFTAREGDAKTPARVPGLEQIVHVSSSPFGHGCAVDRNGRMFVWGRNAEGQLGYPEISLPSPLAGNPAIYPAAISAPVRKCVANRSHTFALLANGEVFGMGELCNTRLDSDRNCVNTPFVSPTRLAFPEPMRDIDGDGAAISATGKVYTYFDAAPLVRGARVQGIRLLTELAIGEPFIASATAMSGKYSLALSADGRVFSWGEAIDALGRGDTADPLSPGYGLPAAVVGVRGSGTLNLSLGNDVFANNRRFAEQIYRDFLLREGDLGGIDFWVNALNSGQQTRTAMVTTFLNSGEYRGIIAPVTRLYFAAYVRIPDFGGLRFWSAEYQAARRTLDAISSEFVTAPEFAQRYGNVSDAQFVDLLYRNVLGRSADAAGLAYWQGQIAGRLITRGGLLLAFSQSAEYTQATTADITIIGLYAALLQRAPSAADIAAWRSEVTASGPQALIDAILASAEYRARFVR